MFSFTTAAKTAVAGVAIAAAIALPLVGGSAAFAGDAFFAPIANDDEYWMTQGETLVVDEGGVGVIFNDTNSDSGDLRIDAMNSVVLGEVFGLSSLGFFTFVPDPSFVGDRVLTYTIKDTLSGFTSNVATVIIHIAPAPIPGATVNPDVYETFVNTPLVIDLATGVLANDVAAWHVNTQDESEGEISMSVDGNFTYTPALDFVGTKTFNYNALSFDGVSVSAWTTVTITVKPITIIPSIPVGNPGDPGTTSTLDGDLPTLAYTGTDDVTAWLIAPALALLTLGGAAVWFTRRRARTN